MLFALGLVVGIYGVGTVVYSSPLGLNWKWPVEVAVKLANKFKAKL